MVVLKDNGVGNYCNKEDGCFEGLWFFGDVIRG